MQLTVRGELGDFGEFFQLLYVEQYMLYIRYYSY